ncbi:Pfam:IML2 [Geosmithia morbida]|uniref:Inclusion body clearance protein IML2 n=1 Tax=Geosmithia morbida TaxID=1094350 RepID=A0A9P4YSE3_9HYPO|nr:Pfam:IML2 [Geosmithia morbida]KAF4122258.1 Pfam:IML2 [Geosmithia morbida]
MSRLGGWLRANVKNDSKGDAAIATAEKERRQCVEAMSQAQLIMNDDVDGAYEALKQGDSSFHRLGTSVSYFMRSVLGMERQVMDEAMALLNDCEARAWDDVKAAEKRGPRGNSIYPAGTEYDLIRAESQLMGAVVGVLHESLVEAMKSFYKLRKAFITLDTIIAIEARVLGEASTAETPVANGTAANGTSGGESNGTSIKTTDGDAASEVVVDYASSGIQTPSEKKTLNGTVTTTERADKKNPTLTDPVDVFIHSGANMCFGILMLILTLVPPSFARVLSVVGYRGDRDRGVRLLWRSSKNDNIKGAIAGMALLGFYNGVLGTADILPHERDYDETAETVGPPHQKCEELLATMRERYPASQLWQIEESRRLSSNHNLEGAIEILRSSGPAAKMKQISSLADFELALDAMFVQDWALMRDTFLRCADTNDWSPALYHFMAGCATLELYRDAVQAGDDDEARRQKRTAEGYLRKAPTMAGKKRFMAGKLPFDVFLERKIQRWEARASELGVDLADAVGVSPSMEVCYIWNGTKRMADTHLDKAVGTMSWERLTCRDDVVTVIKAEQDEMGLWAVCMSATLRRRRKLQEARRVLQDHVLAYDRTIFKGHNKNDHVPPSATYELAAIAWDECCQPPLDDEGNDDVAYRKRKLQEVEEHLEKVKNWESYTLDMRVGLKVQSALETAKWFRGKMGWTV